MSPITVYFSVCPPTWSWWAWRLNAAGPMPWLRCRCGASWQTPALLPRKAAWCWFAQRKLWVCGKQRQRTLKLDRVFCKCRWFIVNVHVFFFSPQLLQGALGIGVFFCYSRWSRPCEWLVATLFMAFALYFLFLSIIDRFYIFLSCLAMVQLR